jgi:hypothetical protein
VSLLSRPCKRTSFLSYSLSASFSFRSTRSRIVTGFGIASAAPPPAALPSVA